jgi:hypothetical protein
MRNRYGFLFSLAVRIPIFWPSAYQFFGSPHTNSLEVCIPILCQPLSGFTLDFTWQNKGLNNYKFSKDARGQKLRSLMTLSLPTFLVICPLKSKKMGWSLLSCSIPRVDPIEFWWYIQAAPHFLPPSYRQTNVAEPVPHHFGWAGAIPVTLCCCEYL